MANRYWVGGTASWDGTAGTKWALTSGGGGGQAVPTAADDVFFDGASGAVTCTVSGARVANSINCTGFTGTLTGTGTITIGGSLTLATGMTYTLTGALTFTGTGTITCAGKSLRGVEISGGAGNVITLGDTFINTNTFTLRVNSGTFSAGSQNVNLNGSFQATSGTVKMGSGTWTATAGATFWTTSSNCRWYPETANLVINNANNCFLNFGGINLNKITLSGTANVNFTGPLYVKELASTRATAYTINFTNVFYIGKWSITGTVGNVVTIGGGGTLKLMGETVTGVDYLALTTTILDTGAISALSGTPNLGGSTAQFYAGANSTVTTGTGFILTAAPASRTLYWVGGTGNWTDTARWSLSSGGAGGEAIPTSLDDVIFNSASSAVTYTATLNTTKAFCRTLTCTAPASGTGKIGTNNTSQSLCVHGNVSIAATNFTVSDDSGGGYFVLAGSSTSKTITTNNSSSFTANLLIQGIISNWSFGSNATISSGLTVSTGILNFSTYTITLPSVSVANINSGPNLITSTLNLNSATLTGLRSFDVSQPDNIFTFNAGTSNVLITLNNFFGSQSLTGSSTNLVTFYNLSIRASTSQQNSNNNYDTTTISGLGFTFNDLTFTASSFFVTSPINLGCNLTVNGTFTSNGIASPRSSTFIRTSAIGTTRTITAAAASVSNTDFQDITIAGAVAPLTVSGGGDCGGNSGITFPSPKTVYWNLSGTRSWGATAWAASSGGSPADANFPLAQDTAIFDNAGAAGTVQVPCFTNLPNLDMTGRSTAMTLSFTDGGVKDYYCNGDFKLSSAITFSTIDSAPMVFQNRGTSKSITSAGKTFQSLIINSIGGSVTLNDNLTLAGTAQFILTAGFSLRYGTFNANNQNITLTGATGTNVSLSDTTATRILNMGSGTWALSGTGNVWNVSSATGLTFNRNTSTISFANTSTTARTFVGAGLTYYNLNIGGATGISTTTITGANTFNQISSTKTVAHTLSFAADQTITNWALSGSIGNLATINSNTVNTARTLTITNRTSGIDYLDVRDITAPLAPVTFYAGANTILRSNVRGVAEINPVANAFIYVLTTGTSFTVPANWNSSNNEIHLFAGGGGGAGSRVSADNRAGGGGGGGGGYTKVNNLTLTPSSSVTYAIGAAGAAGAGGANGTNGGNTTFNAGAYTTTGGGGGQAATTPTSTGGTAGTGSTFNGGVGGVGSTSTLTGTGNGGGGGAGAGGPLGAGQNGGTGFASTTAGNVASGGGGGNGGGSTGGNASSATGGTGGNNNAGAGGGSASAGFNGGGGAGNAGTTIGFAGGVGTDILKAGMGGGGGAGGSPAVANTGVTGGLFGGGGGGAGTSTAGATFGGSAGAQGGIIIWYSTVSVSTNTNMLMMFR